RRPHRRPAWSAAAPPCGSDAWPTVSLAHESLYVLKVRTTFPTAFLSSRYRVASAASDAGNVLSTTARYLALADRSITSSRSFAERSAGTRKMLNPTIVDGFVMRSSESILSVVPAL